MLAVPVNATDHVIGPASARVTLVEYGDFECPYCHQAYGAVQIIVRQNESRLRFVFRHFPLTAWHSHAEMAAEASEAAGAQNKFWPMYGLLFSSLHNLNAPALRKYAEELELDLSRYDYEMSDRVYLQRIREHQQSGIRSQIRSTPAFFVNGELQDVTFGLDHLSRAIDRALRH